VGESLAGQPAACTDPEAEGGVVAPSEVVGLEVAVSPVLAVVVGVIDVVGVAGGDDRPAWAALAEVVTVPDALGDADRVAEPVAGAVSRACRAASVTVGEEVADPLRLAAPGLATGSGAVTAGSASRPHAAPATRPASAAAISTQKVRPGLTRRPRSRDPPVLRPYRWCAPVEDGQSQPADRSHG
jgi:hypothetical protein